MKLSTYGERMNYLSGVRAIMVDIEATLKKAGNRRIINLSAGNPNLIPEVIDLWKKHTADLLSSDDFGDVVGRYDVTRGYAPFVKAIVNLVNRVYKFRISEENVLITPGSQQLYYYALNAFAGKTKEGDKKVLFPFSPEYTGYTNMGLPQEMLVATKPEIEYTGKHSFKYKIDFHKLDLDDIGLVVFSRPCNPSGNVATNEETQKIIEMTKSQGIPVIIDSAYAPPIPNLTYTDMEAYMDSNVLHVMSLSKAGLPGERVGIAIGSKELIDPLMAFQANVCLLPSKFGQAIAARAINSGELERLCENVIKDYYRKKFELSGKCIKKYFSDGLSYFVHQGEGTFFRWLWFKDLPITDRELYEKIKERNIVVVPGSAFFPGSNDEWKHKQECIRISLTASDEDIEEGFKTIGEIVNQL